MVDSLTRQNRGAEGTIIEEPDNLPRMIWGLSGGGQSPPDSPPTQHKPNIRPAIQSSHTSLPPRFQKPSNNLGTVSQLPPHPPPAGSSRPNMTTGVPANQAHKSTLQSFNVDLQYPRDNYDDAIVLENLVQEQQVNRGAYDLGYDRAMEDLRGLALDNALNLQHLHEEAQAHSRLSAMDRYSGLSCYTLPEPIVPYMEHSVNHFQHIPMKVSSRPAVGSALPQILIEPRSPPSVAAHRRLSAMEIAQQYQQQQLYRQHGSLLPTPPSSSSPLWSSGFSPYDDALLSPNWATSQVPGRPNAITQALYPDASDDLRRLYERVNDVGLRSDVAASLAPPAQIKPSPRLLPTVRNTTSVSSGALVDYLTSRDVQYSPQRPAPPPNTPRSRTVSQEQPARRQYAYVAAPLSPTSPEARDHSLSYHQPRSVPFARLIQRRLSAVPEEDNNSTVRGRSPSPSMVDTAMSRTRYQPVVAGAPSSASARAHITSQRQSAVIRPTRSCRQPYGATHVRTSEVSSLEQYGEPAAAFIKVKPPTTNVRNEQDMRGLRLSAAVPAGDERLRDSESQKENSSRGGAGRKRGKGRGRRGFNGHSDLSSART